MWGYREDVFRLARQLCRHRQDAEDVTQTTLLKASVHLPGFRWEASLGSWLHRIATNACRMLRRRPAALSLEVLLESVATGSRPPAALLSAAAGPEALALEAETRRQVLAALATLAPRRRAALLLADGLGLPAAALARELGTSVPAVRALLHRARAAVRAQLAEPDPAPGRGRAGPGVRVSRGAGGAPPGSARAR